MENIIATERGHLSQLYEKLYKKSAFNLTLQVTEDCCMACTYCYQHHKTNNKMSLDVAKQAIDKVLNLDNKNDYQGLIIEFIGGEPLMEATLIKEICLYTLDQMLEQQHPWLPWTRFSLCSNGLLYFTKESQDLFKRLSPFIFITFSIDGDKKLHDTCRVDINNNPTYDKIIKAVYHYRENYGLLDETKMTISPDNVFYLSEALINLINLDYTQIHVNCIFEEGWNYEHSKILYKELKKTADFLIENKLYDKVYIRFFNEQLYCPILSEDNENWCGGVIKDDKLTGFAVDYKGDIYICIRYMESSLNGKQKPLILGNIYTGILSSKEQENNYKFLSNITRYSQSTNECLNCPIAKGCSWCSGYNYEKFGTPNKRATFICCMHQAASLANSYYLNTLYSILNINKYCKIQLDKKLALKIIDEQEYNYLLSINRREKR